VAIQGGSAGGATAVLVAVNEEDVGNSGTPGQDSTVGAAMPVSGGLPPGAQTLLAPVLDRTDAPVLLFYGTSDPGQPVDWPQDTAALLNERGGGAFLQPLQGGHVPGSPEARRIEIEQSSYFMYYMLDLAHAAGQPASAARALDALRAAHPDVARGLAAMQSR
jgi:dienelactone hydrolase